MAAKKSSGKKGRASSRSARPEPGFEAQAPPEQTNYDHAGRVGRRHAVPGAGVVHSGSDAGPIEDSTDLRDEPYPGRASSDAQIAHRPDESCAGPQAAADSANRAGVDSQPAGGDAPLSVPSDSVGPQPAAPDVPELYDPNYTAATERANRARPKSKDR